MSILSALLGGSMSPAGLAFKAGGQSANPMPSAGSYQPSNPIFSPDAVGRTGAQMAELAAARQMFPEHADAGDALNAYRAAGNRYNPPPAAPPPEQPSNPISAINQALTGGQQ